MEQAQNNAQSAKISYESAKNQYDLQVKYTTVTAPIDGVIESRSVEPHDHVSPAGEICTISGASQLQVKFGITEKIHQTMELGDSVTLEKNGVDYTGTYDDENMEVKSGLTSDSQVIVSWSNELVDQGEVLLAQDSDGAQTDGNNETAAETTEAGDKE